MQKSKDTGRAAKLHLSPGWKELYLPMAAPHPGNIAILGLLGVLDMLGVSLDFAVRAAIPDEVGRSSKISIYQATCCRARWGYCSSQCNTSMRDLLSSLVRCLDSKAKVPLAAVRK